MKKSKRHGRAIEELRRGAGPPSLGREATEGGIPEVSNIEQFVVLDRLIVESLLEARGAESEPPFLL